MFFGRKMGEERQVRDERRQHPRLKFKTLIAVSSRKGQAHCKSQDLSLGGMSFIYPHPLLPHEFVSMILQPPAGAFSKKKVASESRVDGAVCRIVPAQKFPGQYQIGVRFVGLTPEAGDVIQLWFDSFGDAIPGEQTYR